MKNEDTDYTALIGPMYPETLAAAQWPMYSFPGPSFSFWNGFANALRERGLTDDQIKAELQSKGTRWILDGLGHQIEDLGRTIGRDYHPITLDEPDDFGGMQVISGEGEPR
jgi:hypothetical protein